MNEITLNQNELTELAHHEDIIQRGLKTFYEVGEALAEIRDKRLYRGSHRTFKTYCQDKWGMTKQNAGRLMRASEAIKKFQASLFHLGNQLVP